MAAVAATFDSRFDARGAGVGKRGLVTWLALAAVALTVATSGIVFSEPAPVDALSIGLIVLLPTMGLVAFNRALLAFGALWLVAGACAVLAASFTLDPEPTFKHVAVTLYLYAACVVLAAFVARSPRAHTELIFKAWTVGALIASGAAVVGYFNIIPGTYDLFTHYDRASGTFKDPNVFGPFLIVPIVYMLNLALERRVRGMVLPLAVAGFLALALFLSFSRGAWINLVVSLVIYGYLAMATTRRQMVRIKVVALLAIAGFIAAGVVIAALSSDQVANLLSERASFEQSYDTGAEGRFGGQEKAVDLIIENPLGIGAQEFVHRHHHEEVHNVYLTMLLNAGWLGGGVYWILVGVTLVLGLRHALKAGDNRMLFLVAFASFAAMALEGVIIDSDHWRHFYLLMAVIWGMMTASAATPKAAPRAPRLLREAARPQASVRRPRIVAHPLSPSFTGRGLG
jgi:O-antigen ligase